MQPYQNTIITREIKAVAADATKVLARLGISAAVLADPAIQAQLHHAIAGMAAVSVHGVDLTVTMAGGAQ
ncbi:hypothetical protein [Pseudomonas putida]